jgi:hypothetical protein
MSFETIFKILIFTWAFTVARAGVLPIRFEDNPEEGILMQPIKTKSEDMFIIFTRKNSR